MRNLIAALAGAIFGTGLWLSGMTDTTKVAGWLDVFGDWDPTLAFVMGGGIVPMAIAWQLTRNRRPVLGGSFPPPPEPRMGRNLVLGSALFGVGWGLAGLCPGPALASLSWGGMSGVIFLIAMIAGMWAMPPLRSRLDAMLATQ
jgi:uncharacterized membrane protein YedE/YeeE